MQFYRVLEMNGQPVTIELKRADEVLTMAAIKESAQSRYEKGGGRKVSFSKSK